MNQDIIIFASDPNYLPALQLIEFLNASSMIQVRGLKRYQTVSSSTKIDWLTIDLPMRQSVKDRISDSEIAVMFIMPADLPDVKKLTHSFVELTQEIGVQRLAWVAPACPEVSELGKTLVHSYKKQGVRILDHHTLTDSFMQFVEDEKRCSRPVHGDWAWLVPPLSGSTTPTYGLELENRLFKPGYFYQPDPWQTKTEPQGCPFHEGI